MKTKLLLLLLLAFGNTVFCQIKGITVHYTFKVQTPEGGSATFYKTLKGNENNSLFLDLDTVVRSTAKIMIAKGNKKLNGGLYSDRANDNCVYFSPIFGKGFYVKDDSLSVRFQWVLTDSLKKKILDFNCKAATCYFRGRNYIAYYTEDVPFYTGPWKFSGLPGLILEIHTTDNKFAYEAYQFVPQQSPVELDNPYKNIAAKYLSFAEHKNLYLKKLTDTQNKITSEDKEKDVVYTVKDNSMELLK